MQTRDPAAVKKTTRIDQIVHEVVLCGGAVTTGTLADRLIEKGVIRVYADINAPLRTAVERGVLRKTGRGAYALPLMEPETPPQESAASGPDRESASLLPSDAAPVQAPVETCVPRPDADLDARLARLLAEKRARLEALVTDQDQNLRVRAHVDELIAHNSAKMREVEADVERLERLRQNAQEISQELGETKPAP